MQVDRPISIAIILFVILLLVFFFVSPEYRTFKELRAELGEKIAEFNAEYDYYSEITKTYYDLKNRQDDIKKVDDALPQDPNLGRLVYYFQKTAAENGMVIRDLFLSKSSLANPSSKTNNVKDIVFSTNLMGDYPSLGKFLVSLEKSSRLFEVVNISFSSNSQIQTPSPQTRTPATQTQTPLPLPQFQAQQIYTFNLEIKTHSY